MSISTAVKLISADEVKEVLLAVVQSDPERVDERTVDEVRPRYLNAEGTANCLVAHLLLKIGFDTELLAQLDHEFPLGELVFPGVRIVESRNPAIAELDSVALALLDYLQTLQDGGLPWMDCYLDAYAKPSRFIPERFVRDRRPWMFA